MNRRASIMRFPSVVAGRAPIPRTLPVIPRSTSMLRTLPAMPRCTSILRTLPILLGLALFGCGSGGTSDTAAPWPAGDASYVFEEPDDVFQLSDDLDEISGLAVMDDGMLAAVQDDRGVLYVLDPSSGEVVVERWFGGVGDYEAVDVAAGRLFVLESSGLLHRFESWNADTLRGDAVQLDLPSRCNAEGMRYDEQEDRLLVSCRDEAGPDVGVVKAIYAYNLDGRRLSDQPVYTLDTRSFARSVEDHPINRAVRSVLSDRIDLSGFTPSDLAFSPITGELFVLSAVRDALVSVRTDGTVSGVWSLPNALVDQPEGIDFLPDGQLLLSSEAGDRTHGVLLRYRYRGSQMPTFE